MGLSFWDVGEAVTDFRNSFYSCLKYEKNDFSGFSALPRRLLRNPASRGTFPNSWHDGDYCIGISQGLPRKKLSMSDS